MAVDSQWSRDPGDRRVCRHVFGTGAGVAALPVHRTASVARAPGVTGCGGVSAGVDHRHHTGLSELVAPGSAVGGSGLEGDRRATALELCAVGMGNMRRIVRIYDG